MMTDNTNKQIEALSAEIDRLKASQPTPIDHAEASRWKDRMHQLSEARALADAKSMYSRVELTAMRAAAPDDVCRDIAMRDARAPLGPSSAGASGQVTKVSSNAGLPGSNSGWQSQTPLGPQPHIQHVDRLMDAADRRDRLELIQQEEARRRAEQKQRKG
jgi:hypothetical protein